MEITLTLSQSFSVSPFEIMEQETDDVILFINHFISRGNVNGSSDRTPIRKDKHSKDARIRVNDKTASGGWF